MTTRTKIQYIYGLRGNARKRGDECHITESDLDLLLAEAGITMADIGQKSHEYALARYNDTGDYVLGNCRFITVAQNNAERKAKGWEKGRPRGPMSEEQKAKRRVPMSEEAKRKISLTTKGRKKSEEHKRKIGLAHKGRPSPHRGKKNSEELRKKKSDAAKLRWAKQKARQS